VQTIISEFFAPGNRLPRRLRSGSRLLLGVQCRLVKCLRLFPISSAIVRLFEGSADEFFPKPNCRLICMGSQP
jgi:hypothetical protein